ncbi:MAG: hypothetical protein US19_C0055G0002 [Candidatus Daviesbacteria bacterium GW2011_GWB1_36_5]|uniref:Uncharacterized protein n=2 Tax=Patescibacteria group TaxID=1783273 RepID=A0A0G0EJ58_9BACT|nr:MAG: hypothetical protein UR88_C0002G0017 [Candidatus Nomurabacteria bacterium GW2011_GWA1_35_8]KKQ07093.1 MAG: hypothetical protein US19_C0055G0002 [Candidatus Daviesbacteria bacterium GW2011_GWB1_36_5]
MSYDEDDTLAVSDPDLDGEEKPLDLDEPLDVPLEDEEEFDPDSRYH